MRMRMRMTIRMVTMMIWVMQMGNKMGSTRLKLRLTDINEKGMIGLIFIKQFANE